MMSVVNIYNRLCEQGAPPHMVAGYSRHQMYVRLGVYRKICNRRARVLRKRGENVFWSVEIDNYLWEPKK